MFHKETYLAHLAKNYYSHWYPVVCQNQWQTQFSTISESAMWQISAGGKIFSVEVMLIQVKKSEAIYNCLEIRSHTHHLEVRIKKRTFLIQA